MSAIDVRRRVERLEAETGTAGAVTVTRTGDLEEVWWAASGRRPVRVKALRGVSLGDL
jgi:hypothetical protein